MKTVSLTINRYETFGAKQMMLMILTLILALCIASTGARAYSINIEDGGDCAMRAGDQWDGQTQTCTLGSDLHEGIIIEDSGITLDGNGFTVFGYIDPLSESYLGNGIEIKGLTAVTVKNFKVTNFDVAILISSPSPSSTTPNTIINNTLEYNNLGIYISGDSNRVYNNNFIGNNFYYGFQAYVFGSDNVFSDECKGGNYWDDFGGCNPDSDGLCTEAYIFPGGTEELPRASIDGWVGKDFCASTVAMDIKPGSCNNPVNVKSKGVLPVVILGTKDFSVATIDVQSLKLESVAPIRSAVFDVLTYGEAGDCNELGGDGYPDLVLKFKTEDIVAAIGEVDDDDEVTLSLTGNYILNDEPVPFTAEDTILVKYKGKHKVKGLKKHIKKVKFGKHNKSKAEHKKK